MALVGDLRQHRGLLSDPLAAEQRHQQAVECCVAAHGDYPIIVPAAEIVGIPGGFSESVVPSRHMLARTRGWKSRIWGIFDY